MKIADYGKAITSYIESPTTAQKLKSKESAENLLAEVDFSGMTGPQLRILYERYTGVGAPKDPKELIIELKRLMKNLDQDGVPLATGGRVHLAEGSEDIVEPSESMKVDTTTKGPDLFTLQDFKNKAEIYVLALHNRALPLDNIKSALNKFTKQGLNDDTFTVDEAIKVVQNLKFEVEDRAQKQRLRDNIIAGTGTVKREDFAIGGGAIEGEDLETREGFAEPKGRFSEDTNKGKLRAYLNTLDDGATLNRQELIKKFNMQKAAGSVTEVLNEFKNKNFKFINPVKGTKTGPKFELTEKQKKLPMLLFGKKENELTTTQRSNIRLGIVDKNTMTPYRVREKYNPFSLKEYGKEWTELTEKEKERVRAGKGPTPLPPGNKVKVDNELKILSKNKDVMEIFKNPNRDKAQLKKDIILIKKVLGKNTNAIARITQLAAALSGDKPVEGIKSIYKKNAEFILNNVPHTKTLRELDELKIGKSVGEKSIKTIKEGVRKSPNYIFTGDYNIDEPAGVSSSVRNRSTPYGIFGQIISKDVNKGDKYSFDGNKSIKEKALQNAIANAKKRGVNIKKDKAVIEALTDFNKLVSNYETKINADIPKDQLKIKLFKASLDSPNNTIKNFGAFNSDYKKAFLNNYKNLGYSFEVPKDIKTIPQISEQVKDPKVLRTMTKRFQAGNPRLLSVMFPAITLPVTGYLAGEDFKKGDPILDIGSSALFGVKPTESIVRALASEEEGGFSETEKLARKKLNILKTVKPSDITTIASLAAQDPEYEGAPAKYLDFLKSQNLESIVEPAEKEFQEKIMMPFRETKKAEREPVISGLNELINQFSNKRYDQEV